MLAYQVSIISLYNYDIIFTELIVGVHMVNIPFVSQEQQIFQTVQQSLWGDSLFT